MSENTNGNIGNTTGGQQNADKGRPYFFQSFFIVVISIASLLVFKQFLPSKIFPEAKADSKNVVVDSLMLEAVEAAKESGDSLPATDVPEGGKITFEESYGVKFPAEDFENYRGYQHLIAFYNKLLELENTGNGKVRIAYFGDSMTDGDMIVKDLRAKLQAKFGGEGVGFVNITSESAQSRSTLTHQFSGNWLTQSYLKVKSPKRPFGVNGHVFFPKHDTVNPVWVRYKAANAAHISSLNNPTLFYGRSGNTQASLRVIVGQDTIVKKLNPTAQLNTLKLGDSYKGFKADFIEADSIPVYGFNFDDGHGVHIDNFSNRGNSGLPIGSFNTSLMKAFNDKLGYDLIVLQYGTNVLNYGSLNYSWYEKRMTNVVNHLRECFPGVTILIVGVADKSTKYGTEMKTDSAVVPLSRAQRRYAVGSKTGFISLYTLMGGDGSMVSWVEDEPAKANKDYTHFNFRGSKEISDLIYEQLNHGYAQYRAMRRGEPLPAEIYKPKKDTAKQRIDTAKVPKFKQAEPAKEPQGKPVLPQFKESVKAPETGTAKPKPAAAQPQAKTPVTPPVQPPQTKKNTEAPAPVTKDTTGVQ